MLRSLVLAAVLLAATAPLARGDDPKPPATPLERIEALQKDLSQKITALQADVTALKAQAARLDSTQNMLIDSWEMRNQIELLQAEVARLRDQLAAGGRPAMPPATSNLGPSAGGYNRMPEGGRRDSYKMDGPRESRRPALGYLRVINEAPVPYEVLLNGQRYVVPGLDTVELPVSAGEFSYQVLGRTAMRFRSVPPGQAFTANINP